MNESLSKKEKLELKRQEKQSNQSKVARRRLFERLAIWGAVVLVVVGIFTLVWNMGSGTVNKTFSGKVGDVVADDHVFGNSVSTITLVEYSDFQCPACRAAEPFVKDLQKDYGNRIRLVYRHFPLPQHQNAKAGAYAAEAASVQGKFWEMHDMLFDNQDAWAELPDPSAEFIKYATTLGLNIEQFKKDSAASAIKDRVARDLNAGTAIGINSTPTFYLNNYQLDLPSFSALRTAIDQELNKK